MQDEIISVAIIEDDKSIRDGIASYIDAIEGYSCQDKYESCEEALSLIHPPLPDIILMDIGLKGISGIEGVTKLKLKHPGLQFLMLTVYEDDEKIFSSLRAGASGYLLKKAPLDKIVQAIKELKNGGAPMTPAIAKKVLNYFNSSSKKVKKYLN